MIRRRKNDKTDKGAPKWMVTFSDMMTLILVFFILLFSMSVVDATKFRAIAESFQERSAFDSYPSIIPFENPAEDREVTDDPFEAKEDAFENYVDSSEDEADQQLDHLLAEIMGYLEENDLLDVITASRDDRGVVLVLQDRVLFRPASAQLTPAAIPFLDKVGILLNSIPNLVKVEGHTDDRPIISTDQYPTNWELSGARASSVIRYLIDEHELDQERFVSVGYGETRPIAPNTNPENLQKNRRVVIVISDPSYEEGDLY